MRKMKTALAGAALALISFSAPAQDAQETTLNDQTEVAVTAYNNGLALVRDVRKIRLPTGELLLRFSDVAEQIQPETVALRSLSSAGSISILEQNYEYDLIAPSKLMEKFVGREVKLVNVSKDLDFIEKTAKLLSVNEGPVYEIEGKIYLGHPGSVVLPEIPENLAARPSLVWTLDNAAAEQTVEASYLTNGLSWHADYVLTIPKDESSMDLAGWVTMQNNSGATYTNAKLKLVAGEVNRAPQGGAVYEMAAPAMAMMRKAADAMPEQEAFGEYHLYTLPRRTTIKQNQTKQLALMDASGAKFKKKLTFNGNQGWFYSQVGEQKDMHAEVSIEFENKKDNALGLPLPGGVMRMYQEDSEGSLQFLGEDRVQHTPKDETVRLQAGKAFDVVADRKQTDFKRVADSVNETEFEIRVRNRKETATQVEIVEPLGGDWEVLKKSHEFTKRDAFNIVFTVDLAPGAEETVSYRVRTRY